MAYWYLIDGKIVKKDRPLRYLIRVLERRICKSKIPPKGKT